MASKGGHRPLLCPSTLSAAARDQLKVIAKGYRAKVWEGKPTDKPLQLCQEAVREAKNTAHDVVIIDTAGRLHIDEALMNELREIKTTSGLLKSCSLPMQCSVRTP
jgi:signal recognition particle subunit SRP54